ncbi:MAG: hypothetical protein QXH33_05370 [Candidatus Nitrosocaldus sp.]
MQRSTVIITVIATVMSIGIITITNEKMHYIPSIALYNEPRVQASERVGEAIGGCYRCFPRDNNYVVVKVGVEKVTIKFGDSITIPVTFTYVFETLKEEEVTIITGDVKRIHFPASLTYSEEEMDAIVERYLDGIEDLPKGVIDESSWIKYIPSEFTLKANESKTIEMVITIPSSESLPKEVVDEYSRRPLVLPVDFDIKQLSIPAHLGLSSEIVEVSIVG